MYFQLLVRMKIESLDLNPVNLKRTALKTKPKNIKESEMFCSWLILSNLAFITGIG